jgi:hypothetical protein
VRKKVKPTPVVSAPVTEVPAVATAAAVHHVDKENDSNLRNEEGNTSLLSKRKIDDVKVAGQVDEESTSKKLKESEATASV